MKRGFKLVAFSLFVALIYFLVEDSVQQRNNGVAATQYEDEKNSEAEQQAGSYLVADSFEIVAHIQGSTLELSLSTDLPGDTQISIIVGRSYWEKGNSEEYARSYYENDATVGEWRKVHEIDISPAGWKQNLKDFQAEMARATLGFEVARISNDIDIDIVIPVNGQNNPAFGRRNSNLRGKAVTTESYGNVVRGHKQLAFPL